MALQLFKIETVEVASPVTSVTFSSIPQGYTDLIIKVSARGDNTLYGGLASNNLVSFNGSTASFSGKYIEGSGTTVTSGSATRFFSSRVDANATANTFASTDIYIPNYTSANYKSYSYDGVSENNATAAYADLISGLWSNTAAITSITIAPDLSNFATNSTFTLYGVL